MASKKAGIVAGLAVAGLAAAGLVAASGTAFADPSTAPSSSPSASAPAEAGQGHCGGKGGRGSASQDTPVTGDEARSVIDAVTAKNAGVTIETVRKDPDGSYDALGARADGTRVMFDVSTDLATITENTRR